MINTKMSGKFRRNTKCEWAVNRRERYWQYLGQHINYTPLAEIAVSKAKINFKNNNVPDKKTSKGSLKSNMIGM